MAGDPMRHFSIAAPRSTHSRPASCEEVDCERYRSGFEARIDEATPMGQRQAAYIRGDRSRRWSQRREGMITVFTFGPGTSCFTEHRVSTQRPPLFMVRDGYGPRSARSAESWVDDMQESLDRVRAARERQ